MTDQELRERQKLNKEKRQRELRKHMMLVISAIAVVVVVIIAVFVPKRGNVQEQQTSSVTAEAKDSASGKTSETDAKDTSVPAAEQSADTEAAVTADPSPRDIPEVTATPDPTETPVPSESLIPTDTPVPTEEIAAATVATPTETPTPEPEPAVDPAANVNYYNSYVSGIDRSTFAVDPSIPCGSDTYPENEKVVYLTLDDGPSYLTEQFLEVLDRYNVKATFFVTGQNPDYFYLIKEAYDRGHTIGLHTYTHDYSSVYASVDSFFNEIYSIGEVVRQQIGYMPCFIRFPGGSTNTISDDYCPGIMPVLKAEVQARGFQYYDWNCSSGDGGSNTNVAELAAQGASSPFPTTILLSHDANGKEATLLALPAIIEYYLSYGYEFRPLDRTTFTAHQS